MIARELLRTPKLAGSRFMRVHTGITPSCTGTDGILRRAAHIEEERLVDNRFHVVGVEGLGNEEGRFWPRSGQQPLRIGRHENDGDRERTQNVVDGIEAGASVCQLDVGQDEAWPSGLDGLYRLLLGARDLDNAMAKCRDQPLAARGL